MAHNTIFSWTFLQTVKDSIITYNNDLISGILGYQFKMEMMVTQRAKETPKTPEGLPVSSPVETQNNTKDRCSRNITVELKRTVIHQHKIPVQN